MGMKKMLKHLREVREKDEFTLPDDTPASCQECDWKGIITDCGTEMESDGWEYPEYEVLVCPNCGEYNIEI